MSPAAVSSAIVATSRSTVALPGCSAIGRPRSTVNGSSGTTGSARRRSSTRVLWYELPLRLSNCDASDRARVTISSYVSVTVVVHRRSPLSVRRRTATSG